MPSADPGPRAPDTIAAIATPMGRGAIGIVRVSGPAAPAIAERVLGRVPLPRVATLAAARDARGETLDEGLALYFPAPHSYTGEPVVELETGSPSISLMVAMAFSRLHRMAWRPVSTTSRAERNSAACR